MAKHSPTEAGPQVLGSRDAGRYVGLSSHTLKKWRNVDEPPIPFVRLSPKKAGYLVADLDQFLAERRRGGR